MLPRLRPAVIAGATLLALTGCGDDGGDGAAVATHEPENAAMTFPVEVAPETMSCTGAVTKQCLQIRRSPNGAWELFYDTIEGFDFQPGYRYHLKVQQIPVPNPPADAAPVKWKLLTVVDKQPQN